MFASDLNKIEEAISTLDSNSYDSFTATTTGKFYNGNTGSDVTWNWIVHKHNDGLCECFGEGYFYCAATSSITSPAKGPSVQFPITFKVAPHVTGSINADGRDDTCVWCSYPKASTTETGAVHYFGYTHDDRQTYTLHVVGRWK